jgi:hypothetical protein
MRLANTLYEPRAFWSVLRLRNDGLAARAPTLRAMFPRNDFLNGEKYNVTLTHLCLSGIGYPFEVYAPAPGLIPTSSNTFRNARGPVLERARLSLAASGRYYLDQDFHALQAYGVEQPTGEPERLATGAGTQAASTRLFNVFRWAFDEHLFLPRGGTAELLLGTYGMPALAALLTGVDPDVRATIAFEEARAGFWPSATRIRAPQPLLTAEGAVYPVPAYGNEANGTYLWPGANNAVASPQAQVSATEFLRQAIGGQGSPSSVRGFAVALDQITHDDESYNPLALTSASKLASIGERLSVRGRNVNGGSQADWWRPNAPLSLVSPSMTTALVYKLHEPIMLAPGDSLDVQIQLPEPVVSGEVTLTTDYQVGVSFCGSAAIQA